MNSLLNFMGNLVVCLVLFAIFLIVLGLIFLALTGMIEAITGYPILREIHVWFASLRSTS